MNKGGKASAALTLELARRMRHYGIVPEFSFVLGWPPDPVSDVARTFEFIRRIKQINPATEIVLYTYTPVPLDGSLYTEAQRLGFAFPETLERVGVAGVAAAVDAPRRRHPVDGRATAHPPPRPQLRARDQRVLPDRDRLAADRWHRAALRAASAWRYGLQWYGAPYELRALHRLIHYQRPETTGF